MTVVVSAITIADLAIHLYQLCPKWGLRAKLGPPSLIWDGVYSEYLRTPKQYVLPNSAVVKGHFFFLFFFFYLPIGMWPFALE